MSRNGGSDLYTRLIRLIKAWGLLRPTKSYAGYSLEQFNVAVAPSFDTRKRVDERVSGLREAMSQREDADRLSRKIAQRVVNAVKADAEDGEDSELYSEMGYIPRSVRNSLQAQRRTKPAEVPEEEMEES